MEDREVEDSYSGQSSKMTSQHRPPGGRRKGGLATMPFVIANEAFEKVASFGLLPNMILYLMSDYRIGIARGTNVIFLWSAATNFMPVVGAFLSDSYLGRFLTIAAGCVFALTGMVLLWLTTMIPQVKPPPCRQSTQTCEAPTTGQFVFLISSFALMSIGAGGIRACSLAFGADQLDKRDDPKNKRVLESFFGWYYASTAVAVLVAFTGIVYIQDNLGWRIGFGVPAILMFLSAFLFFLASPLYIKMKVERSLITSFAQVIVVAFKNRNLSLSLPPQDSDKIYHQNGSKNTIPTTTLRFLNKACIFPNQKDTGSGVGVLDPWVVCTVEQVEELKALIRVLPLWSASIMLSITVSQGSFPTLQAKSMERHLTKSFQIPAGSFIFFTIVTAMLWIGLYDRILIPLASKLRRKPVRLGARIRMGIGLLISCIGMGISGLVEHARREKAIEQGFLNDPQAVVSMSAMWLVPQHCLTGLAEAFNVVGLSEFLYSEFPKTMSSIASALFGLQGAVANLLASVILNTVDKLTKGEGKEGWISTSINKGRYENYYWLLGAMSAVNCFYYVFCCWLYGPCVGEGKGVEEGSGEEDQQTSDMLKAT